MPISCLKSSFAFLCVFWWTGVIVKGGFWWERATLQLSSVAVAAAAAGSAACEVRSSAWFEVLHTCSCLHCKLLLLTGAYIPINGLLLLLPVFTTYRCSTACCTASLSRLV
eukprot:GHRQ01011701.1.p2 GENE.GHRQ01011701.1~~GHRQ01011701.1.p2  ORF type:complete len:111 (-),score=21.87 GHRQ01011701.1:947-1279(-)